MSLAEKLLFLVCNKLFGSSFEQFLTYSIFLEIGIFYLVYVLGLVLFIFFSNKAVVESKKYLIPAFFGLFTMIGTMMGFMYINYHNVQYGYDLYKKIIDTTYEFEKWKNNHPELIEKLEKFIEYKELEE